MAKAGGIVTEQYMEYTKSAASQFKAGSELKAKKDDPTSTAAGDLTDQLNNIVSKLPEKQRKDVLETLDEYAAYLMALRSTSEDRLKAVLQEGESPNAGPGGFLARWQNLIDSTPTTPTKASGKICIGSSRAPNRSNGAISQPRQLDRWCWPDAPDVKNIIRLLQDDFRQILAEEGRKFWMNQETIVSGEEAKLNES